MIKPKPKRELQNEQTKFNETKICAKHGECFRHLWHCVNGFTIFRKITVFPACFRFVRSFRPLFQPPSYLHLECSLPYPSQVKPSCTNKRPRYNRARCAFQIYVLRLSGTFCSKQSTPSLRPRFILGEPRFSLARK